MRNCTYNEELLKLFPAVLIGAEGDGEGDGDGGQNDDGENDGENEDKDAGQDDNDKTEDKSDNANLLKALQAERRARAAAEKEAKALKKAQDERELSEKSELEQAQTRLQERETRAQELASALLNRDLNDAIRKAAQAAQFIDTDDAIAGVDRNKLSYEQDEDDPTQVTIDEKSVEREVKALAAKKRHFIRTGTDDGEPSGSQFGGKGGGSKGDREKTLRSKYPTLGG